MGKKRVPISLRKPPSPDAAARRANTGVAPEVKAPAPEPEVAARVAEPEIIADVARAAEPEVAALEAPAPVAEPEVAARVAEPEIVASVAEPEVAACVAEPEIAACVAEPVVPQVAGDALQLRAPDAPIVFAGADGGPMRAVTIYLPSEVVDRLMLRGLEQGADMVRDAIEASLQTRLAAPAPSVTVGAGAPFTDTARPMPRWVESFRGIGATRGIVTRVERWIEVGRAIMTTVRVHVRSGAEATA